MFGTRWRLFRMLGIPISLDASWLIIRLAQPGGRPRRQDHRVPCERQGGIRDRAGKDRHLAGCGQGLSPALQVADARRKSAGFPESGNAIFSKKGKDVARKSVPCGRKKRIPCGSVRKPPEPDI